MRPITILLISVALLITGGLAFFSKRLVEVIGPHRVVRVEC
jgi:hypothetical protein